MRLSDKDTISPLGWMLLLVLASLLSGCGDSSGKITALKDGTLVWAQADHPDFKPQISFSKAFDKTTGEPVWPDTIFTLQDKEWLNAIVSFDSLPKGYDKSLVHLDWVAPDNKSMFTKRFDVDSAGYVHSSVSLSSERRDTGRYTLKVYYFRELIARKSFYLLPAKSMNQELASSLMPQIEFCARRSKKTGQCINPDSVFIIHKKGRVRAIVNLLNRDNFAGRLLQFELEWVGPDGDDFYTKKTDLEPDEEKSVFGSAISIPPEKRKPGTYGVVLKLYGEIIAEKSFVLTANE